MVILIVILLVAYMQEAHILLNYEDYFYIFALKNVSENELSLRVIGDFISFQQEINDNKIRYILVSKKKCVKAETAGLAGMREWGE